MKTTGGSIRPNTNPSLHCEAYLGCGAKAIWIYTMKSGRVLPLCQDHAESYGDLGSLVRPTNKICPRCKTPQKLGGVPAVYRHEVTGRISCV
jgi:hypothetical protein